MAPRGRRVGLGVAVALVAVSAACSIPSDTAGERTTAPTPTAAAGLGDAPSPTAGASSAAGVPSPADAPSAAVVTDAAFVSPSGNIGCYLTAETARCDIAKKSWAPPPAPDDCDLDWASGVAVGKPGEATFTCAGDTVLGAPDKLEYGQALKAGPIRSDSSSAGMRCENTATGHGFTIAKERYDLF